jgi:hypothetical protein
MTRKLYYSELKYNTDKSIIYHSYLVLKACNISQKRETLKFFLKQILMLVIYHYLLYNLKVLIIIININEISTVVDILL